MSKANNRLFLLSHPHGSPPQGEALAAIFSSKLSKSKGLVNQIFTRPFSLVVQKVVQKIIICLFGLLIIILKRNSRNTHNESILLLSLLNP